jgi:DNA (cytosine-5)-methyltransferase 1
MSEYEFIDLFAGIGGTRLAFENNGCKCVFSSEIDESAIETYKHNFGEVPDGDITKIDAKEIPDHDILVAGFPCPSFSIIGNREGFDSDKGELFFEIERILTKKRPQSFLLENVKNLASIGGGDLLKEIISRLETLGYYVHWEILNALDFGLPQKRERIMIVGFQENYDFEFPKGRNEEYNLEEVLEEDPNPDYEATDYIKQKRKDALDEEEIFEPAIWHENKSGNISLIPYSVALRANASYNYILVNGRRHPTPREMLRFQGFPEDFEVKGSAKTKVRKQLGNTVPVAVIEEVAANVVEALDNRKTVSVQRQTTLNEI